jgi:hypothetical protein
MHPSGYPFGAGPNNAEENRDEMAKRLPDNPIFNFQGSLGLIVLVAAGVLAWCHLNGLVFEERPVRARAEATELARAAFDYHQETGDWPRNPDGEVDLTPLLGGQARRTDTVLAAAAGEGVGLAALEGSGAPQVKGQPWLKEIPLDPWGRPYRVLAGEKGLAVLSTGPDGRLDTDPNRMWKRPGGINPCDGDDIGIVLESDPEGELR